MIRSHVALLALAVAGCASNTGVRTSADFTSATLVPLPPHLAPPTVKPEGKAKVRGVNAVAQASKGVIIHPTDQDMDGLIWRIENALPNKIYAVPVAPMQPTTILLPIGETLNGSVAGNTQDFTIAPHATGDRAAITIMPNCASPNTERFGLEAEIPLVQCMSGRVKATFLTSGGPYNFEFHIYDYTAAQLVEVNHGAPPETNTRGARGKPPFPRGPAEPLKITAIGDWNAGWKPTQAYADAEKMVIRFPAPLPALPGLYTGLAGEQAVNYSVVEADNAVFMVTSRRVTEAELRLDDQVVRIESAGRETLKASKPRSRWSRENDR